MQLRIDARVTIRKDGILSEDEIGNERGMSFASVVPRTSIYGLKTCRESLKINLRSRVYRNFLERFVQWLIETVATGPPDTCSLH